MSVQIALTYADGSQALLGTGAGAWTAFNADPVYLPTCCTSDPSWFLQPAENFDGACSGGGGLGAYALKSKTSSNLSFSSTTRARRLA